MLGSVERVSRIIGAMGRHKGFECRSFNGLGFATLEQPAKVDNGANEMSDNKDTADKLPFPEENLLVGRKITHLTIQMGRTDWWSWKTELSECENNPRERLRLEPMINSTHIAAHRLPMTMGYEARKAGKEPDFGLDEFEKQGRWGLHVGEYWPDLTTLKLVLETFMFKKDQLDYVIECAKLWNFPLGDGYHLVWDGTEEAFRWRGASSYYNRNPRSSEGNSSRNFEAQDPPVIRWRPEIQNGCDPGDAQEFIVQTMTFKRRRISEYRTD